MDYTQKLKYHYKPKKGWVNDPNGLVYYDGYYHLFYQHAPDFEEPRNQPMHWGHARTRDFIEWEELPVALYPDTEYDKSGCWSGTAIVRDNRLYLMYTAVNGNTQAQCVAYSDDGINFTKYPNNPVIAHYPPEGREDFRDPAVWYNNGKYYCAIASGNSEGNAARVLLYVSDDLFAWEFVSIMCEWKNSYITECPSVVADGDKLLVAVSVITFEKGNVKRNYKVMYGKLENGKFVAECESEFDKGPDQYAGQLFKDCRGRNIIIDWIPGWGYEKFHEKCVGCFSVPREIKVENGVIKAYPVEECRTLLKDRDDCLTLTENGFTVERTNREPLVYHGDTDGLKIIRDGYVAEIFMNGGHEIYTVLL